MNLVDLEAKSKELAREVFEYCDGSIKDAKKCLGEALAEEIIETDEMDMFYFVKYAATNEMRVLAEKKVSRINLKFRSLKETIGHVYYYIMYDLTVEKLKLACNDKSGCATVFC